jgi:cytochrome c oxidase accessory protein FixG
VSTANPNLAIPEADAPVLSTLEQDGSRRWIYPRLATGRFWSRRRAVAYALLALFTLTPFLRIGGKPVLLLDVMHRRFTLLGTTFLPTDMALLALFALIWLLSIFFVTALLGRVWCGWVCPQTVYMEFVFRPIERLFTGRAGKGGRPAGTVPGWRTTLMYATCLVLCLHLANTFLAYFVPAEVLNRWITSSPANHPAGFAIVLVVTGLMMFNFAWFREQTCIIACPYGRLQSVLLDRHSLVVSYDAARGEPRGKKKAAGHPLPVLRESGPATGDSQPTTASGDCVDCTMCVQVCPTGIDIRNGLQFECVACAQCIDACDAVMDKVGRPRGLIRYGSQAAMAGERVRVLRPRVVVYSAIVTVLIALLTTLLVTKAPADVTVLRGVGRPFVVVDGGGTVENTLRLKIVNRTDRPQTYTVVAAGPAGVRAVMTEADAVSVEGGDAQTRPVRVLAPSAAFRLGHLDVTLRVTAGDGTTIDRPFRLLGPSDAAASNPVPTGALR